MILVLVYQILWLLDVQKRIKCFNGQEFAVWIELNTAHLGSLPFLHFSSLLRIHHLFSEGAGHGSHAKSFLKELGSTSFHSSAIRSSIRIDRHF